jgi:adenylate cyclase
VQLGDELFGDKTYIDSLPPLSLGVGVDQGEVLVGSFGSSTRRTHALLGKTVTMAMRYQGMTEELAYPVIFSKNILPLLEGDFQSESIGSFMLEGNQEPTELFVFRMDSMEKGG